MAPSLPISSPGMMERYSSLTITATMPGSRATASVEASAASCAHAGRATKHRERSEIERL
jgi:hypothetical protein